MAPVLLSPAWPFVEQAQKSLDLQYYIWNADLSGSLLTHQLLKAADRGVRVRILIDYMVFTDVPPVHAGYQKYRKPLLAAGIELYEINDQTQARSKENGAHWLGGVSKSSLHAKFFIFDRQQTFIGSYNFDPRSTIENTEIGIVLNSPRISNTLATLFEQQLEQASYRLELSSGKLLWHQV